MGSMDADTKALGNEKPPHNVALDAFWVDQTEVTNAMFAKFVSESGYETDAEKKDVTACLTTLPQGNGRR